MTKALFVTHTAAPSGAELATLRMAIALRNIDVEAVFTEDGPMVARMRAHGVDTRVLDNTFDSRSITIAQWTPFRLVAGFLALTTLGWAVGAAAKESKATVLVAESTKALVVGAVAARRAHIPLVWHVHDRISTAYFGRVLSILIRLFGWSVSRGYIANSRSTMNLLFTWRRSSLVAYPGVRLGDLDDLDRESQRSPAETIVAVVGRLTRWKGQDVFLRALADAAVRPRHVYLVGGTFFDEEPFRDELHSLAAELDLPVTFTGHVDRPDTFMKRADILVHCSVIEEPFGQVVVEGMHAGCAVIATKPGGTTEIIESGVNGLLVDGGNQQQLTDALDTLIGDRELRQRLSTAGRLRAEHFDITESARTVGRFLEDIECPHVDTNKPRVREGRTLNRLVAIVRDICFVSFGKYGQYVVTVMTLPLIARMLGTEGLGLLAIGMASYFIGSMLVDLGITTFLAAMMNRENVNQLRGSYLAIRAATLGTIGVGLISTIVFGANIHLHMILLGMFAGGFWSISEDWVLIGQGRFGASMAYQGVGRIAYLLLLVSILPRLPSAPVAILCLLVSSILTVSLTWLDSCKKFGRPERPRQVTAILRIGAPVLTSRLLVTSYGQGAAAVYSSVLDAFSLGLFSAGDRLVRAIQSLLDPIGFALLPRLARNSKDDLFWRRAVQALLACVCAAGLATTALWIAAPTLIDLVFGGAFADAVPLLRVELLILPATAVSSFITTAILPVRQDTSGVLIGAVLGTCVSVVALYFAFRTHSVWALVYGTLLCEFIVSIWFLARMRHLVVRERRARIPVIPAVNTVVRKENR